VARKARALAASGVDVVDLGLGEPDFATPEFVARAGVAAIEEGRTRYTDTAGEPVLRDAIADKYRREHGVAVGRENVLVTAGAKQAVFNACQVLFEGGDEVGLFCPYWVSFPEIIRLSGASPLLVPTELTPRAPSSSRRSSKTSSTGARRARRLSFSTRRTTASSTAAARTPRRSRSGRSTLTGSS
jgi:aspartate/methionine/tyrosine aminotransferase